MPLWTSITTQFWGDKNSSHHKFTQNAKRVRIFNQTRVVLKDFHEVNFFSRFHEVPDTLFTTMGGGRVLKLLRSTHYVLINWFNTNGESKRFPPLLEPLARRYALVPLFCMCILCGWARTQSPANKNYAPELPTFGVIARVSNTERNDEPRPGGTASMITVSTCAQVSVI